MRLCDTPHEAAPGLWVGSLACAQQPPEGVRAMLSLMAEPFAVDMGDRIYLRLPVPDGPGFSNTHMAMAVEFLQAVHPMRGYEYPTLVHCAAGMSRSVAVVATYLHLEGDPRYADLQAGMTALARARGGNENMPVPHLRRMAEEYAAEWGPVMLRV